MILLTFIIIRKVQDSAKMPPGLDHKKTPSELRRNGSNGKNEVKKLDGARKVVLIADLGKTDNNAMGIWPDLPGQDLVVVKEGKKKWGKWER